MNYSYLLEICNKNDQESTLYYALTFNFSTCFKEAANSISGKTSGSL